MTLWPEKSDFFEKYFEIFDFLEMFQVELRRKEILYDPGSLRTSLDMARAAQRRFKIADTWIILDSS